MHAPHVLAPLVAMAQVCSWDLLLQGLGTAGGNLLAGPAAMVGTPSFPPGCRADTCALSSACSPGADLCRSRHFARALLLERPQHHCTLLRRHLGFWLSKSREAFHPSWRPAAPCSPAAIVHCSTAPCMSNHAVGCLCSLCHCSHLQEVNISEPGSEPSPGGPVPEDMRLLHADMADKKGVPWSWAMPSHATTTRAAWLPRSGLGD